MNKKILIFAVVGAVGVGVLTFMFLGAKEQPSLYSLSSEDNKIIPEENEPIVNNPTEVPIPSVPNNDKPTIKMNTSSHLITLKTSLGDITFKTYDADAPKTVDNFITLAEKDFYNSVIFHRVIDKFMIQAGDPTGTGMGGPGYAFADELNPSTDSYKKGYAKGTVAMANSGPNTNGSQFFIMVADVPLPHNYTIFGSVVSGQDVADKISQTPRSASDKPLTPVFINKVIVEDAPQG